jgi:DNA-binding LacI/PurR family transcriptional regulator
MAVPSLRKLPEIQAQLRRRIFTAEWKVGDKLPSDVELAKSLGCSIGTLSKALGFMAHDGLVARRTKSGTRVLRISARNGASELNLDAFAFIYPSERHEGISGMLHGFERAARKEGRRLITIPTGIDSGKEAEIIARLDEFDVRGLVACPAISTPCDQLSISQLLLRSKIPVVLIGLNLPGFSTAAVLLDNFLAGYEMTRHLLSKGCKRIGFLSNYSWMQFMRDRFSGYRRAMEEAGIEIPSDWIHRTTAMHVNLSNPILESTKIAEDYLARKPSVEGVVCADDFMAVGLIEAATVRGLNIPNDLRITGIDDFSIAKSSHPLLTTYRVPYKTMGERAFELIDSLVSEGEERDTELFVRGEIIIRESA